MNPFQQLILHASSIEERLCYIFQDRQLLAIAFVHRSFYNEHREVVEHHNERLEFLGDSVLGILISEYLYIQLPQEPEGHLSSLRSHLVDASTCATLLNQLDIAQFILLGRGERMNDGRGRETILADLFEALIGAIYLDGGIEAARKFLLRHFENKIQDYLKEPLRNWKAELQDYSQKKYQKPPIYKIIKEMGPDHSKVFQVAVAIGEAEAGEGTGASKKEAEQTAAEDALKRLGINIDPRK